MSTPPLVLADLISATPRDQWGTTRCVAWVDGADRRCTRPQENHWLCDHHHNAASRKWQRRMDAERERMERAALKRAERLPKLMAERMDVEEAINRLDPPDQADTQAFAGATHPSIQKAQQRQLSGSRVEELARLVERLRRLDQQIGDQP